jgi:polar amino acid transport system substrate-binding protein
MAITEQEGRVFSGNLIYKHENGTAASEDLAGVIGSDNKSLYIAGVNQGYSLGSIVSKDEIELIYLSSGKAMSVGVDKLSRVASAGIPHADLVAFVDNAVAYAKTNGREMAIKEFNNNKSAEFIKGDRYIFACDFNGVVLANPYRTDHVGKDELHLNDTNGVEFVRNQLYRAEDGLGYAYYIFPNPAHNNKLELKLTYVEKVDDTWWLASGIYLSNMSANFSQESRNNLISFVDAAVKYAKDNGKDKALKTFNDKNGTFFNESFYVFAYDFAGNTLALPIQPDLIGKNRIDITDPNGVEFTRDMIALAKSGRGFTYYIYPDPARNKTQVFKLSYVAKVDDTWWLGAGVYA